MKKNVFLTDDLPSGLRDLMRMFWEPEEASDKELNLPEAERVEAFLQWCRKDFNWEGQNKKAAQWLIENGYTPIPDS